MRTRLPTPDLPRATKALISRLRKLHDRKEREAEGRFIAEGPRIVAEAIAAGLRCDTLLVTEAYLAAPSDHPVPEAVGAEVFLAQDDDFRKAADTNTPQGILGLFEPPDWGTYEAGLGAIDAGYVLILDSIQDPGNVGTAIRVAAGFGADAVVLTPGCADVWNPKTVRASAGAAFRIPLWRDVSPRGLRETLGRHEYAVWCATIGAQSIFEIGTVPGRLACVLGHETRGPEALWLETPGILQVSIPMQRGVESLNVGTAAAALCAILADRGILSNRK